MALLDRASDTRLASARRDKIFRDSERALRETRVSREADGEQLTPASFRELFDRVDRHPSMGDAVAWAERGRYDWPLEQLTETGFVAALANGIARCADNQSSYAIAVVVLAHMLDWIEQADLSSDLEPVLSAALDLVIYGSEPSASRDTLIQRLLGAELAARSVESLLSARLDEILQLWLQAPAAKHIDWPLTIVDTAIDYCGASPSARTFFLAVLSSCAPFRDRLDSADVDTIRALAAELETGEIDDLLPAMAPADPTMDPLSILRHKFVGIYTLMIGAGTRAKQIVERRCPQAVVETNNDTVASPRLVNLAERADAMVVAYQHAQHAATDAIIAARGRERVIRAAGKGTAGLIRALERWALDA